MTSAVPQLGLPSNLRRRGYAIVVAALAALALVIGAGVSPANAAGSTTATISSSEQAVWDGQTFTLTAQLRTDAGAFGSSWVKIQYRLNGTSNWADAKSLKTNAQGKVTYKPGSIRKNIDYRMVFTGTNQYAASASAPVTVYAIQSAKITKTSTTTLAVGQTLTVKGITSPMLAGATAYLQMFTGEDWITVGSSKVDRSAAFGISAVATQGGKKSYRVLVDGLRGISGATSMAAKFNIYEWFPLPGYVSVSEGRYWDRGTSVVAGTTYSDSVLARLQYPSSVSAEYNLSYRCNGFSATIGISDYASSGSTAHYLAAKDGIQTDLGTMTIGSSKKIYVDTAGGFRLLLKNERVTSGGGPNALWADPKLLCLSQP